MDEFDGIPLHVQNALKRAGITSVERARALGRDAVAQVPGVGPLALSRLFPSGGAARPRPTLSAEDLRRARRWFEALREAAPEQLSEEDRALAAKISALSD